MEQQMPSVVPSQCPEDFQALNSVHVIAKKIYLVTKKNLL
jgi:hypothetical protein